MKTTKRSKIVSEIKKLIKDKEHLFDTTIELTGSLDSKRTIDSVTSDGVFINESEDVNKTELVLFDDIINKDDLELVLETLTEELSK